MSGDLQTDFAELKEAGTLGAPGNPPREKKPQRDSSHDRGPGTSSSLARALDKEFFDAVVRAEQLLRPGASALSILENTLCGIRDLQKDCIRYPNDPKQKIQIDRLFDLAAGSLADAWEANLTDQTPPGSMAQAARHAEGILSGIDSVLKSEDFAAFRGRGALLNGINLVVSELKKITDSPATHPESAPDPAP